MNLLEGVYKPSSRDPVREQVELYERTDGEEGSTLWGMPVVVLTSKGAKTGRLRKTPLMRIEHQGSYAIGATDGGAPHHPAWYHNVVADPIVQLQDRGHIQLMQARELTRHEKQEWMDRADQLYPFYREYREKAGRDIPLILLEPVPTAKLDAPIRH
jgi:deazaflavin-dependent oxidoreductase (nitroreductase family)